jgi:hypothetical protein
MMRRSLNDYPWQGLKDRSDDVGRDPYLTLAILPLWCK